MKQRKMVAGILSFLLLYGDSGMAQPVDSLPVFQVDVPYPTTDKPQCKLWFASDCWWALLPCSSGPSLWQRSEHGWVDHAYIRNELQGIPGRMDVWYDASGVTAVAADDTALAVVRLEQMAGNRWASRILWRSGFPKQKIETATIARDDSGQWWVAADLDDSIMVWTAREAGSWQGPFRVADGVSEDDICTVSAVPGSVLVSWSDQRTDAVMYREHKNGRDFQDWGAIAVIDSGEKTADDHLHSAIDNSGILYIATKNSLDETGHPQLVMRVRKEGGSWRNFPYLPREKESEPSRPVVVALAGAKGILAGHTIYNKENRFVDHIEFGRVDTSVSTILSEKRVVIRPAAYLRARINDVTVPRAGYKEGAPWIILASDGEGRVYEGKLERN